MRRDSPAVNTLVRLLHNRMFVSGLVLFGIVLIPALLAPWIAGSDPNRLVMRAKLRASSRHMR